MCIGNFNLQCLRIFIIQGVVTKLQMCKKQQITEYLLLLNIYGHYVASHG